VIEIEDSIFSFGKKDEGTITKTSHETTEKDRFVAESPEKSDALSEKEDVKSSKKRADLSFVRIHFSLPRLVHGDLLSRRTLSFLLHLLRSRFSRESNDHPSPTTATLRRIARTRRLVTSLTRLLATKSEVMTQIRKRLLTSNSSGLRNNSSKEEDVDVAIYMGDVQGACYPYQLYPLGFTTIS
jgi:magnesium transporter